MKIPIEKLKVIFFFKSNKENIKVLVKYGYNISKENWKVEERNERNQ